MEEKAMGEEYDIFNFGSGSSKIQQKLNAPSRAPGSGRAPPSSHQPKSSSSHFEEHSSGSGSGAESSSGDETGRGYRVRRHSHRTKSSLAASRLLTKPKKRDTDVDEEMSLSPTKRVKLAASKSSCTLSPSPSPAPYASPLPSPPPPGTAININMPTSSDNKSRQVLNKANDVLNRLLYSTPSDVPLYDYSPSFVAPSAEMTLRVRCKGRIRKYAVGKFDPFSKVIALLTEELEVAGDNKVLLSHKSTTLKPTDSPGSLCLTTADIIDGVVMTESSLNDSQNSCSGDSNTITIKVQTSNRHMMYSLAKNDPLQKAMTAFASELKTTTSKLKFSFDGDTIIPTQTAQDLDMENDDCIDVIVPP